MATLEELVVQLTAETSSLRSELANAAKVTQDATNKIDKAISTMGDNSTKSLTMFEQAVATMGGMLGSELVLGAVNKITAAFGYFKDELVSAGKEMVEEEKALTGLANALALNGQYTTEAMADMEAYAEQMEVVAGVAPKTTAANLQLLESMTKLSTDGLKKAHDAAVDMAAAYNMDVDSAVRLVGKGIEGNTAAFKRYGIEIKEGGSKSENLANILHALSGAHGAAAGQMKNFAGVQNILKKNYEDMFENVAKGITQNEAVKAMMIELSKVFGEFAESADKNSVALKQGFADAIIFTVRVSAGLVTALDAIVRGLEAMSRTAFMTASAINDAMTWVASGFTLDFDQAFQATKDGWEDVKKSFSEDTKLGTLAESLLRVADAGEAAKEKIGEAGKVTAATVTNATTQVVELTAAQKAYNEALGSFANGLAEQGAALGYHYENELAMLEMQHEAELVSKEEYLAKSLELMTDAHAAEDAALQEARNKKLIDESKFQDAKTALLDKQNKQAMEFNKKFTKFEADEQKTRTENLSSTFATIATLSTSSNKTLAAIGKAAAITTATIDGIVATQKALASAPPPFNFALAGLVGVATAANVAKIAGVQLASGIDSVPGIGSRDNFPAVLAPGERVVPKETNKDLKNFLKNGGTNRPQKVEVTINIQNNLPASREAGAVMIEYINEAIANGSLKILGT